jgi:Fe-S cluster biogenesis protein NfuA
MDRAGEWEGELMGRLIGGARPDTSSVPLEANEEERMEALINILSDYVEHYHGGSVELVSFDGKRLQVRMGGACVGCDLSPHLLDGWIAGTVRPFFPNLEQVEAVE